MSKNHHVKCPLFLSDFDETIFSTDFRKKKVQISTFVKIRAGGVQSFHADGETNVTKLTVAFRDSANATKLL